MSEPISLASKRWSMDENPNRYTPRDVLVEALRQIDNGEVAMDHVVVIHGRQEDGSRVVGYYQGGMYSGLEGIGLVNRGLFLLNSDE